MIIDAVKGLNTDLPVDPITDKQYVPSLRVVLPPSLTHHFYYRYAGGDNAVWFIDAGNQAWAISATRSQSRIEDIFKVVNTLQNCSRQITLSINKANPKLSSDKLTLATKKILKDGRVAYIYQNDGCPYGPEAIIDYLKQVESF